MIGVLKLCHEALLIVAQDVQKVNVAAWLGVAVGVGGLVVGVGALVFAYLAWRVSKEELTIAQEGAELRPNLVASLRETVFHWLPPDSPVPYEQATIVLNITNNGRTAAHGVRCEVVFNKEKLEAPHHTFGENNDFTAPYMGPRQALVHGWNVSVREYSMTEVRYVCTCDEVGAAAGIVEVEIPKRDQQ